MATSSFNVISDSNAQTKPLLKEGVDPSSLALVTEKPPSQFLWLKYAMAAFLFGAVGQFSMGFMSENIFSRFILSLGNWLFVVFYGFGKYLYFRYQNNRWATIKDCAWFDETGKFKPGTFKYLLISIFARFFYGFAIIIAFGYANANKMNIGIVLSVRSGEALFVALWTYLGLHEKLSHSKLLGLFILTGGVVGLCLPKDSGETGFSIWAILWAVLAALISAVRNFAVKALARQKVDGDTITLHAVFWADLLTAVIGAILCIWGLGYNHEYFDKYLKEESIEFTWRRFWLSIFVGGTIFFSLTTTANANQIGYAGFIIYYVVITVK